MPKNYIFKDIETDVPTPCFGCPNYIMDNAKQLTLGPKIRLLFHKKCAAKVERSLEDGFVYCKPRPILIRAIKMSIEKDITLEKQTETSEAKVVHVVPGDYIAIDIDGTKRLISEAEFEKNYTIIEKTDD